VPEKIDEHSAGIDYVDLEAVRDEPGADGVEVGLSDAKAFAELLRGDPFVERSANRAYAGR